MSSRRNTHWCHTCRRGIRLQGEENIAATCIHCGDGFLEKLYENVELNPLDFFRLTTEELRNHHNGITRRASHSVLGNQILLGNNNIETLFNVVSPRTDNNNSGIDELFDRLSAQGHRGPPPASHAAINSMPRIKLKQKHLKSDLHCPICKDRFEIGSEARKMACKHMYHFECIVPWLVQHNSCPVCRKELPQKRSRGTWNGGRNLCMYLWPFKSSASNYSVAYGNGSRMHNR